jgi:lon-related putative ATP-dependent protease
MPDTTPELIGASQRPALGPDQLYRKCDPSELDFTTTAQLQPLADHFGQARAVEALEFGLHMAHEGYNIFVLGSTGVGKRELLEHLLKPESAAPLGEVHDWCYVNNFDQPDKPDALRLPRGMASKLRRDMVGAVEDLLELLPSIFHSDEYGSRVQELSERYHTLESEAFQGLAEQAAEQGIAMVQTPSGYTLAPMKDGEIINSDEFEALPEDQKHSTLQIIEGLKEDLKAIVRQLPGWKKESRARFKELNREFSQLVIDPVFEELKKRYQDQPGVMSYLDKAHEDVIDQAESFTLEGNDAAVPDNIKHRVADFPQYSVNILVENQALVSAPVVYEDNPTYANLIGRVEYVSEMGALITDFTLIKPGALHRANGGYLILDADKILTSPFAWQVLKRALKAKELRIQSLDQIFSFVSTVQLQPEPIALDVKVVLTGDRYIYYILEQYDPEFSQLFKVPADMSEDIARTPESTALFARMIRTLQLNNKLLPLDQSGVARVIELAARNIEDGEKLSLHQGRLNNLLMESDHYARREGVEVISADHVRQADRAATHRLDQFREKSHEGILRDIMLIETGGASVGQVNGLSVYLLGDYAFGKPTRITATARLGAGKVLDIEREVDLGGKIHSKAVMIISALLANRYARDQSFPVSASLVFEQSYGGIEGDSASIAELIALISAIAGIPVRQCLAITGSLNQHGQVQAVGGINEKIEGFFDICQSRGLDGQHGVVIPRANEVHLMLRQSVLDAVAAGTFHIHSVASVDEALELMLGFTAASIDAYMHCRIEELQALSSKYADRKKDESDGD